jgi:thiol-disulfide isomerase/thioredoxin
VRLDKVIKSDNRKPFLTVVVFATLLTSIFIPASKAATNSASGCNNIAINSAIKYQKSFTTLPCLVGSKSITLEEIKGPTIINVFGSWCPPCREELPFFKKAYATGKVNIIGIDVDEVNKTNPINFIKKMGLGWPILFDGNDSTKAAFGPGVPVTWFLNKNSVVSYKQVGVITSYSTLQNEINKYLGVEI